MTTTAQGLFSFFLNILNQYVVPIIFAVAFLMFLVGVYRYFIAGGASEEKVQEGQKFVMWSIIGFVIMFSIWGLINLFINTLGFDTTSRPALPTFGTPGSSAPANTNTNIGGGSTNFSPTNTVTSSSNCGSFDTSTGAYGTVCSTGYSCVNNQCVLNSGVDANSLTAQCGSFNDYDCSAYGGGVCSASGTCQADNGSNAPAGQQGCTDGTFAPVGGSCYSCGNNVTTANGANCPANTVYTTCKDGTVSTGSCLSCQSGVTTAVAANCSENGGSE